MTNYPIVFCILLAVSVAHSGKPLLPSRENSALSKFDILSNRHTEQSLNKHLDKLLSIENKRVADFYYSMTNYMLNKDWYTWSKIHETVQTKRKEFNAALGPNKEDNERSRKIFEKWVQRGLEFAKVYMNAIRKGYSHNKELLEEIDNASGIFRTLCSYKTEVHKCFHTLLRLSSNKQCKKQIADKIRNSVHPVRLYMESMKKLQMLYEEIAEGEIFRVNEEGIPIRLLKFYKMADTIVKNAMAGVDLRFRKVQRMHVFDSGNQQVDSSR